MDTPDKAPCSLLGVVRDEWSFVHSQVCISSAARADTHVKEQAFPPALNKGRHHPGISPGQQEGASSMVEPSPPGHNQHWWKTGGVIFIQLLLRVHTNILGKKPKYFPPSLFQNTSGFYNPPRQHLICSPSPCGKL